MRSYREPEPRPHAKGGWSVNISIDGARRTFYGKTAAEARRKMREAVRRHEDGAPLRDSRMKVAAWVARWQETTLANAELAQGSRDQYASAARLHVVPRIGGKALADVAKSDCEGVLTAMKGAGLSPSYRRQVHTVLALLFTAAEDEGLIKASPMAKVKRPAAARKEATSLSREQVQTLVAVLAQTPWLLRLVKFLLLTGTRRGEALGLRWEDVDEAEGLIRLEVQTSRASDGLRQRELKTEASADTVDISAPLADVLRAQRKAQMEARMKAPAGAWTETGLVFTTAVGTAYEPNNINRAFRNAVRRAGLPTAGKNKVTPHTLRHSAATFLLEAGVTPKEVQKILRHASIRTTMDIYAHVSAERKAKAMGKLGEALGW